MNRVIFFILTIFLISCSKDNSVDEEIKPTPELVPNDEIITIPIVVHVVNFAPSPFVISDEKIISQITVLNEDFRKKNSDYTKTPSEFMPFVADVGIEFKLATVDPEGNPTTGIIRNISDVTGFEGKTPVSDSPIKDLHLYHTAKGGQDAWPNDKYLNIWIADLSNRNGVLALNGYSTFPGDSAAIDGVVMDPRVFGTLDTPILKYNRGRTATHEIGHWLGLLHIFGKGNSCEIGDGIDDTPNQYDSYAGKPSHPQSSCGSNDMFMNFMDYVDDDSMCMFTTGQRNKMRSLFNKGGARRLLYENLYNQK